MSFLIIEGASKRYHYDEFDAFTDISFSAEKGETVSLIFGAQGGKTSFAKILMGLTELTQGKIEINSKPICQIPPCDRNIAYVTLPMLYAKKTVEKNVAFGLKCRNYDKETVKKLTQQALTEYGLINSAKLKVASLTIYQQLCLALARAFVRPVDLAIFDNVRGIDSQMDVLIDNRISKNQQEGITTLLLCDKEEQALGKIYKFSKMEY
jgi:ABC-type Fe3+/spermidine/putrescine transport system ATPase subunit